MKGFLLLACMIVSLMPLLADAAEPPRRWVLSVGQNRGVGGDEPLRFAEDDARKMENVLREIGFSSAERSTLLVSAKPQTLREQMARLMNELRSKATPSDQLWVYVSSHAAQGELHLEGETFPLAELTAFMEEAPVSVGILVLDTCQSGYAARQKGLVPERLVSVSAVELRGRVVMTSSGPNEFSQESDVLQASNFTHHFLAALRGAADFSHDGKITLDEAYRYAWTRTIESSFGSQGGLQRPHFQWNLRGQGELVLTELATWGSTLSLTDEKPGRWQVLSSNGSGLVLEVEKTREVMTMALPPGDYRIQALDDGGIRTSRVQLRPNVQVQLQRGQMAWAPGPRRFFKGTTSVWNMELGALFGNGSVSGLNVVWGGEGRVTGRFSSGLGLWGLDTAVFSAHYQQGLAGKSFLYTQQEVDVRAGAGKTWDGSWLSLMLAADLGAWSVMQSDVPPPNPRMSLSPYLGVVGDLRVRFRPRFGSYLAVTAGVAGMRRNAAPLAPMGRFAVSTGLVFEL